MHPHTDFKLQFVVLLLWRGSAPRLPCVKGAGKTGTSEPVLTEGLTTPPSEIKDFAHLPLHRGGFAGAVQN